MTAEDDEAEPAYHGPYKITYLEPWRGIMGIESLTDIQALYEDLVRWQSLIVAGDGVRASAEIEEVLIKFRQPGPVDKLRAGNARWSNK